MLPNFTNFTLKAKINDVLLLRPLRDIRCRVSAKNLFAPLVGISKIFSPPKLRSKNGLSPQQYVPHAFQVTSASSLSFYDNRNEASNTQMYLGKFVC